MDVDLQFANPGKMAQQKADFIKVPTGPSGFQTMPVEPEKRFPESEVNIRMCDENDAEKIVGH